MKNTKMNLEATHKKNINEILQINAEISAILRIAEEQKKTQKSMSLTSHNDFRGDQSRPNLFHRNSLLFDPTAAK